MIAGPATSQRSTGRRQFRTFDAPRGLHSYAASKLAGRAQLGPVGTFKHASIVEDGGDDYVPQARHLASKPVLAAAPNALTTVDGCTSSSQLGRGTGRADHGPGAGPRGPSPSERSWETRTRYCPSASSLVPRPPLGAATFRDIEQKLGAGAAAHPGRARQSREAVRTARHRAMDGAREHQGPEKELADLEQAAGNNIAGLALRDSLALMLGWSDRMTHTTGISTRSSEIPVAAESKTDEYSTGQSPHELFHALQLGGTSYSLLLTFLLPTLVHQLMDELHAAQARQRRSWKDITRLAAVAGDDKCLCDRPTSTRTATSNGSSCPPSPPPHRNLSANSPMSAAALLARDEAALEQLQTRAQPVAALARVGLDSTIRKRSAPNTADQSELHGRPPKDS